MTGESGGFDFSSALAEKGAIVNAAIAGILARLDGVEPRLKEAMDYTLGAPGKRIRAAIVLWSCEMLCGEVNRQAEVSAAAIGMVHTYSLIHDDLPAMDDDDMRRGQPSCHKAFDEATAILAGDALLTLAFEILACEIDEPELAVELIKVLSQAAGSCGMVTGQAADLRSEKAQADLERLQFIHTNKTARMFGAAAVMGALCGGANEEELKALRRYGLKIGLGFQVADDILDISGSSEHLGKTAGKDVEQGKLTYPALAGIEQSRHIAGELADEAVKALAMFGEKADVLRNLACVLLERTR